MKNIIRAMLLIIINVLFVASFSYAQKQPNIIVILADDLGYHNLGIHGSDVIKSPNIDKLAQSGIQCTNGYVTAAVCSPSRAGMLSGQYQQRFGHEANVPPKGTGMDPSVRTIAARLKTHGYRTGIVGKWHLGDTKNRYPTNKGFDYFYGFRDGSRNYFYTPDKSDKPGDPHAMEENGKQVAFDGYITDRFTDKAIEFIENEKESPFFLFVSYNAPHGPFQAKEEDIKKFPQLTGNRQKYAAMIWCLDEGVGKINEKLENEGLLENTIIWFLSDNGGIDGFVESSNNYPFAGHKGLKFEGGIRVPFFISWKGTVPANHTYNKAVSSLDIGTTSLYLAGSNKKELSKLDGVNLLPYLTGINSEEPHEALYWKRLGLAAVRSGDMKMIRVDQYGHVLYDLSQDESEQNNLATENSKQVLKLNKMLESWEKGMIEPLWGEGTVWPKITKEQHINIIENKPFVSADVFLRKLK